MDMNTSQKSKSQSKRINRCDLAWFQCLADLFELCPITCKNATAYILIRVKRKRNAFDVPHVDWVGFLFFHCLFSPLNKSTCHFMSAQKLMISWSQAFSLSNSAFLKSVGHMTVIKMYFKKILMAKGQQLHSKPANTSRQISKTKPKHTQTPNRKTPKGKLFHLFTSIWSRY